jgi:hypothetical protein
MQVNIASPVALQVYENSMSDAHPSGDQEWKGLNGLESTLIKKKNVVERSGHQPVLLVSSSPSDRINAIYAFEKHKKNRKHLLDALFEVMKNDPNVNVRMAALDVLSAKMSDAIIRKRLVYAMLEQENPMVQLMMIQLFSGTGEKDFLEQLGKIIQDPGTDEEVREEARFSFAQQVTSLN